MAVTGDDIGQEAGPLGVVGSPPAPDGVNHGVMGRVSGEFSQAAVDEGLPVRRQGQVGVDSLVRPDDGSVRQCGGGFGRRRARSVQSGPRCGPAQSGRVPAG